MPSVGEVLEKVALKSQVVFDEHALSIPCTLPGWSSIAEYC